MQQIFAFNETALIVRHWFEINLDDASMEHGCRVELRELRRAPHRGTESAAQVVTADHPLWRADLFDRLDQPPGQWSAAHYHPDFSGVEPSSRCWDDQLTQDPWSWLASTVTRWADAPTSAPTAASADLWELSGVLDDVLQAAKRVAPTACTSVAACAAMTRDARDAVQLMVRNLEKPSLLDRAYVEPWLHPREAMAVPGRS